MTCLSLYIKHNGGRLLMPDEKKALKERLEKMKKVAEAAKKEATKAKE